MSVIKFANDLRSLGFASYRQYLDSDLWKTIRARLLAESPECQCCKRRKPSQVHHRSYSKTVMAGKRDSSLIVLCAQCHRRIEFDGNTKVRRQEANRRLNLLKKEFRSSRVEPRDGWDRVDAGARGLQESVPTVNGAGRWACSVDETERLAGCADGKRK